ncbi:MAG: hypothetical protein QM820_32015 [Minicystis sp.]
MNRTTFRHPALLAAIASLSLLVAAGCKTAVIGGTGNAGGNGGSTGDGGSVGEGGTVGSGGSVGEGGSVGDGGSAGGQGCVPGGCSGQYCIEADADFGSTCEWNDVYACYHAFGTCSRGADGQCGWQPSADLQACVDAGGRLPASGQCVRNAGDACSSDDDCQAGGCGGELCFNPSLSNGASTCDCSTPAKASCGCVNGTCAWWKELL